ncbi:MAG: hypothetical protein A3I32_01000 [Candidatus Yanofskybacteria bacterium RIFCSPLOWO2_02_FULL_45_10]|uniref:Uncharacterized protein n=2 Tax=Candidatus Yanofskyibacteriota TaxID=1752733 RepID=A0A1F8G6B4_9BACT|nr:MAG: hypothetical protein A3F25_01840 [Candidatus Yanofskybacteria bacterium RIFCSPHIGHO2_12_FULL_45_19b]OGN31749.1 MAG: hypothetical protein A3I32_01000 [Candidatus Yanofskybacteria bacterium RIFCSPLOWO2_02_FULL_45_10]
MKKFILLFALILVLIAGWLWFKKSTPVATVINDPKNIAYEIEGESIPLKDGSYETEAAPDSVEIVTTEYFGNDVTGDFNNDGTQDAAFILTQGGGGTGVFYYLVVALKTADGYVGTNGLAFGDRVAPQSTEWRNDEIILNYADRKPDETFSVDPSVGVSKYFQVQGRQLVEIKK